MEPRAKHWRQSLPTYRARIRHDEYLANGWPKAKGFVEGACKKLIKDRMERTGMR
jgi:hypothetical protein